MSTPEGQQEPYGSNPYQPGTQPPQAAGGQETYAPEGDIPRQQAPREDQYTAPGPGQYIPGQRTDWAGGQPGSYGAYPPAGGYAPGGYASGSTVPPYLQGAPVDFGGAVRGAIGNVFTYRGRASRSAFWWFALLGVIADLIVGFIFGASRPVGIVLYIVVGVPLVLTSISLAIRRLHDTDRSGWWWLIGLVPFVGGIVLLVFYLLPGTPGPNRFNLAG